MDPITIMSILVLAGFIGAGADLATGGLVRAELGGGSRGAAGYLGSAGRKRWQESKRLARQERMKTPTGRAVQFILDELGGLGRGLVRGWRSGARRGRKQWRECLNGQPIPAVRAWRGASESARTWLDERAAQLAPNGPNGAGQDPIEARTGTPNGDPERVPEQGSEQPERAWWDPNGITEDPFLGSPERDPNGDPPPPRCPDCGMALVVGSLSAHRLGRDRCPYAPEDGAPPQCPDCGCPLWDITLAEHWDGRDRCPYADLENKPWAKPGGPAPIPGRTPYNPGYPFDGLTIDGEDEIRARHPDLDSQPLTDADRRFWTLRDRGYPGPINQDGWPVPEPGALGGFIENPVPYLTREPIDPPTRTDPNDTPNGDPNGMAANPPSPAYGSPATGDRDPHVFDCGCCGTVHEPLEPGAHCPNCHLHDYTPNAPTQPTRTEGTAMTDVNSAPAAIALFEAFRGRFEEPESLLTALRDEIASAADAMGDFAIGGEGDLASSPQAGLDAVVHAKEALDGYLSALHLEYDASIEAASSKAAAAHAPMQEV